jgi:hypothetical protein
VALYSFGDASGAGFGQTFATPTGTMFCYGVYGKDKSKLLSNCCKLSNLVSALEQGSADGQWQKLFFCKGHSSSQGLDQLALHLQKLEMDGVTKIHMVHVAGTQMIHQGTDGLS